MRQRAWSIDVGAVVDANAEPVDKLTAQPRGPQREGQADERRRQRQRTRTPAYQDASTS